MRLLLVFILLVPLCSGLEWSEIFFDPTGSDNGLEFVELVGSENLSGCTIADTQSSDTLVLLQTGTEILLIVEIDGSYQNDTNATVYSAGKAIGNGLGNTYEELTITCDEVLLTTSYNVSELDFSSGMSIVYENGWHPAAPTPGYIVNATVVPPVPEAPRSHSGGRGTFCNTTLALTVGAYTGRSGDTILFSIVSGGYASFTAEANGEIFLEGDTLTRREYSLVLPETDEVILTAFARQCDAKQRAKRIILVEPSPPEPIVVEAENVTKHTAVENETSAAVVQEPVPAIPMTGNVVYNQDRNIVPWVSGFGMMTLLVSAGLFFHLRKENETFR